MKTDPTEQDVERLEGELEDRAVSEELKRQYFAEDEFGNRLMAVDPEYRRQVETAIQAACELRRSVNGVAPEGAKFEPRREPSKTERAEYEKLLFATTDKGERLMAVDAAHRRRVEALGARLFGTHRRDATGRIVG